MPDVTPPAQESVTKEFASFLGEILAGEDKALSASVEFFVSRLKAQHSQHQQLVKGIAEAETQASQLKAQAIKLEGNIEQCVAAAQHFWLQEQGSGADVAAPKAS
jgi:hypothetical protein